MNILSIFVILVMAFPAMEMAAAQEPTPFLVAFPEWESVEGYAYPLGVNVRLEIDDPSTADITPDYFADGTVVETGWGGNYVKFNFWGEDGYDLKPDDIVSLIYNGERLTHRVRNLSVANVDVETDSVMGMADPREDVFVNTYDDWGVVVTTTTLSSGEWIVNTGLNLEYNSGGRAQIYDELGNSTAVDWSTPTPPPNPHFTVFPEWEWFDGYDWPDGAIVTITVGNKSTCQTTAESWGGFFNGSFPEGCDIAVDDSVTFTDGETVRMHTIRNLAITGVDEAVDTVSGTADPYERVYVWQHEPGEQIPVEANEYGEWLADLSSVYDIRPGSSGRSEIRDGQGNATAVDWRISNPRVYANLIEDGIRYEYSAPGALVTFSIYDSPDGNLLWEDNRTADDSGFASVSIWDHRVDLKQGIYIVVSDGTTTKQLLVETVSLEVFDPVENVLQGTASPGRSVWVVANNESVFCGTNVIADEYGMWTVDFDDQGCDVAEGMWSYAQVMDLEEDTSEAVLDFIEGYHDYDTGDVPSWACNAGGWAVDTDDRERDLAIRILADGSEVTSLTAGNPRDDLLGACGADGSCGFEVSLWGLITPYEEHQITVQAYDHETEQWFDLSNTPKTLTCRTYDVYTFEPAAGRTKQITNLPNTHEFNPRWSPDGKNIVHDTWALDWSSHGVYITNAQTGVSTPLAGAEGGSYPTWSPSGKWIAFDRGADNDYRLFIISATGGTPKLVTEDAFMATWAPNGRRLAFHRPNDGSIRIVDLNGGNETLVVENGNGPAWSPDGEWIAFERDGNIWKVRVNNNGNPLGAPIQLTSSFAWEGRPTWSNNSQTIAFHAGMGQDTDIWTIPASGSTPTWLTGAPVFGDYDPNYSFNGRYIAYSSFSPNGQAARSWVAAYTYDLPAESWSEGEHRYHFEAKWNGGGETTNEILFNVSNETSSYDGYALLRPGAVRAGPECQAIDVINLDQSTRFVAGYVTDYAMTYLEALVYFDSLAAKAVWDRDVSAELVRHEIIPFNSDDWFQYVCTFTE